MYILVTASPLSRHWKYYHLQRFLLAPWWSLLPAPLLLHVPKNHWSIFLSWQINLHFLGLYVNGIRWHMLYSFWLLSFRIIILSFFNVDGFFSNSFLFIAEKYSIVRTKYNLLILFPLTDVWVVSGFWLFQLKRLWTFMHKALHRSVLSFLLSKYLEEWLNHMAAVWLTF